MTRAEAERVAPDATRAREFLTQARRFFADADGDTTALESAVVWLGADERLVLDPVRLERLGPAPLGVLRPRALEPRHLTVAFEGEDVRRHAVEEPAVVGDDDRTAGEVEQRLLERAQRVDVEVVRRLVEKEHVAAASQKLREMHAVPLAAGEVADALLLIRPA